MLPTGWIRDGKLSAFRWVGGKGSANVAALTSLICIAHASDDEGSSKLTYDQICMATGLSRAKLSEGLTVLVENGLIERSPSGRSTFRLVGFNPKEGWGKLPARRLYSKTGQIAAFEDFKLRHSAELVALKMYLLIVAFRNNSTNLTHLSYDKFEELAGIERGRIKKALSLLINAGLVHVERIPSTTNEHGMSNAYRLTGIDPFRHPGTTGRSDEFADMIATATQS